MSMKKPIRFGIIACSRVAERRFLPALLASKEARLEHVGSRSEEKALKIATAFNCRKCGSYKAVLEDPEVDAIYLSTPPLLHAQWIRWAAEAGKHILCEKPAFPDYETATEVVEICRKNGVRLVENYAFTYHPQHVAVTSLLQSDVREPKYFSSVYSYPLPAVTDIRYQKELGAGVTHDTAGYPIAAAMMHFGSHIESVFGSVQEQASNGVGISFSVELNFGGGVKASGTVFMGGIYFSTYSILGTKGVLKLQRAFAVPKEMGVSILLKRDDDTEQVLNIPPADQFRLLLEDFCSEVRRGDKSKKDFEDLLLSRRLVLDAALLSAREKRLVDFSAFKSGKFKEGKKPHYS